jgi:hypothetical protein
MWVLLIGLIILALGALMVVGPGLCQEKGLDLLIGLPAGGMGIGLILIGIAQYFIGV